MSTKTKEKTPTVTVEMLENIGWGVFDNAITAGKCKIKQMSDANGWNQNELKNCFVAHYGDRIVFKRGCKGGVFWAPEKGITQ